MTLFAVIRFLFNPKTFKMDAVLNLNQNNDFIAVCSCMWRSSVLSDGKGIVPFSCASSLRNSWRHAEGASGD